MATFSGGPDEPGDDEAADASASSGSRRHGRDRSGTGAADAREPVWPDVPSDGGAAGDGEARFLWGLTPNDDPDPLVHGASGDGAHAGAVPPTPAAEQVAVESGASDESPEPAAAPATPQPPWDSETPEEPGPTPVAEPPEEPEEPPTAQAPLVGTSSDIAGEPGVPAVSDADPEGHVEPVATDPDLFAAFAAASATAALPGASAGVAASYDVPSGDAADAAVEGGKSPGGRRAMRAARFGRPRSAGRDAIEGDRDPIEEDAGGPSPRAQRIMLLAAGAMLLVLLLIALFMVGRALTHPTAVASPSPSPTATATSTPTPTPTPTPAAAGPQPPGVHAWNTLRGGECLQPFTTPWADAFTVVDCAAPHAAQLVYTAAFSTDPKAAFPGADQLASQINLLCSRPGILDMGAAGQYDDAQLQGSYPVTAKQWKDGVRSYYCFVSRASGQPITGSLAGPGPQ